MRIALLIVGLLLAGCASPTPASTSSSASETTLSGQAQTHGVTLLDADYQASPGQDATFTLDIPVGTVEVRFDIAKSANAAGGKATLTLATCGSATADWNNPTNMVIQVGMAHVEGHLCQAAQQGSRLFTIAADQPATGRIVLTAQAA